MTTIAWDGRYVAADSQATRGSCKTKDKCQKIIVRGKVVYAASGSPALFKPMVDWIEAGANPADVPPMADNSDVCVFVFRDGKANLYRSDVPYPEALTAPEAWGSGCDFAMAAMDLGKDAKVALQCAIKRDIYSCGPIRVVDLRKLQGRRK